MFLHQSHGFHLLGGRIHRNRCFGFIYALMEWDAELLSSKSTQRLLGHCSYLSKLRTRSGDADAAAPLSDDSPAKPSSLSLSASPLCHHIWGGGGSQPGGASTDMTFVKWEFREFCFGASASIRTSIWYIFCSFFRLKSAPNDISQYSLSFL